MSHDAIAYLTGLVTNRDRLRAELAKAEEALFIAVDHTGPMIHCDEDPRIEAARASCRRIRSEFEKLDRLVDETMPPGRIESWNAELRSLQVEDLRKLVSPPRKPPGDSDPAGSAPAAHAAHPAQGTLASDIRSTARQLRFYLATHATLMRQSLGLLALVLAYLAYYWVDIQLTIITMPAVFWNPEISQISIAGFRLA